MADILTTIVEKRKADIQQLGMTFGFEIPEKRQRPVHDFLTNKGVILEVKRASPSKGDIAPDLDSAETARSYASAGAAAISCLTESNFFKGNLEDLMKVCKGADDFEKVSGKPAPAVLRKDFLLYPEEVEISYRAGADAILLITRILDEAVIVEMAKKATSLGMTCLVEVRSPADLEKLSAIAETVDKKYLVCGVNSRDLATFKIDLLKPSSLLAKIRGILGDDARVVFESGIRTPQAASFAGSLGFCGMLLGEAATKNLELRSQLVKSFVDAAPTKNADFWNSYASHSATTSHAELVSASPSNEIPKQVRNDSYRPLIKICGLTRAEDLVFADSLGVDFVGFIFAAGFARNVCGERFEKILPSLKNIRAKKVAVITDPLSPEAEMAARYVEEGILDCLQFHGIPYREVPQQLLDLPHYFAITEKSGNPEEAAEELFLMGEPRFLQDSKAQNYAIKHKLWLAGGVTPENAAGLAEKFQPELIDISSGIEDEDKPGIKNLNKMKQLISSLRGA
ncbi:bifunctional indole-3-glycerol phosphate synthase/phosphoribosylanthranilate isomerase [Treponema bryantii]|uniref:bifunctional indole-3-glycerol phosphate synthase/phosphoribosylanthranilate isomerase n=1 Tax=Treponema bryantii TaxID=163 RepID=UPI0003B2EE5A|nr:bifunctional indole-3-glycerol phosphate synthase/phosphoribosylanthranilate isomerase [Treponema bryantii]